MKKEGGATLQEEFFVASQRQLIWWKFRKHKLAIVGGVVLIFFYTVAVFCEFFAPYGSQDRQIQFIYCPPTGIHFFSAEGFSARPFVYGLTSTLDEKTYERKHVKDPSQKYTVYFFVRGSKYKLWGLFETDIHLFGTKEGSIFLFGTDKLGRDVFSRSVYAARISLSIGLVGVFICFILGCVFGGISGYYGGAVDMIIQRAIELLISVPSIPLWMSLAAALPQDWSSMKNYFFITIILSTVGWCGLARVVRGKLLELRQEDFVMAAKISGAPDGKIITRHLLPSFFSYLIVNLTLSIPNMIMGETALSFLGLGIRAPAVSWGSLLFDAQNFRTVALFPWLLIPALFVIVVVLCFNFVGDGLRDAADPYK
jgi:peptide/nickel transport system permease protein